MTATEPRPVSFKVRTDVPPDSARIGQHVRCIVFAGPDPDHRAHSGVLVLLPDEAQALTERLQQPDDALDVAHLERQRAWSEATFGPGPRTRGILDHMAKEMAEVEADPTDLGEWVDLAILALDGAWRAGHDPAAIIAAVKAKQTRNEARTWPDWRTMSADQAIEHDRSAEA